MAVKISYFVHSTTTDNEKGLATGWLEGKLSTRGLHQAKTLADLVSRKRFNMVFCSDLKRAIETTNIAFASRFKVSQDVRLRECDYGDFTIRPKKIFKDNMNDYIHKPFPNGESYKDVENRISEFVEFLKSDFDGQEIAIVAHQAPQLALEVLTKGKTWQEAIAQDWRKQGFWQPGWEYVI